ncbi:MAG: hypothetical protein OXG85_05590 [Chloroflexi bacterium]|nr:hypothetical protein [Chloroflexota bacterium]
MLSHIRERWRQDRLPILLYLITFVVMSYPFVFRMQDSLPIYKSDGYKALWQNWWMRESLSKGGDLNFSELIFHPQGLDVTLDPRRWSTFPLWTALYTLFGDPLAFNLTALLGILFKAYGMYLLGIHLFQARMPAWVAGAFYAFAAPSLSTALQQPNTGATEWIPWFMLCFACALTAVSQGKRRRRVIAFALAAGLCFALNMYMNLKIGIFAMLLGGGYLLWNAFAHRLWARRRFWLAMLIFASTAASTSAPLLMRTLQSDLYAHAIDRPVETYAGAVVDLTGYFSAELGLPINHRQIIASLSGDQLEVFCLCQGLAHVGVVAFVFAVMGAVHVLRFRRAEAVWVVLAVFAFLLSLGVVIHVGGRPLDIYWTPYRLLQDNFFFRALWLPFRMVFVLMFPLSVLIGYGLHSRLRTVELDQRGFLMLIVSVAMLLYGTSMFPLAMTPSPRPGYMSALAELPAGAVIDLPMGRIEAKYYMALQRFHGRSLVEGMLPRMPLHVYDYIKANPVLRGLRYPWDSEELAQDEWRAAVADLQRDGFRYLILHRRVPLAVERETPLPSGIEAQFASSVPIYKDHYGRIYDLAAWNGPFRLDGQEGFQSLSASDGLAIRVGDNFVLRDWSLLGGTDVARCHWVEVESWWEALEADTVSYSLTLILAEEDGDGQVAIGEKIPADLPTSEWRPGLYYRDRTGVFIPCNIEAGKYVLLLGMKEIVAGAPLAFQQADGSPIGSHYYLTTLNLR